MWIAVLKEISDVSQSIALLIEVTSVVCWIKIEKNLIQHKLATNMNYSCAPIHRSKLPIHYLVY